MSNGHCVSVRTPNTVCTCAFLLCCNEVESYQGQKNIFGVCSNFSYFTGEWFVLGGCRKVRNSALSASSASTALCTPFVSSLSLILVRYLCGAGRREGSLLSASLYCESTVAFICREGEGAAALCVRTCRWELLIAISSFNSFSSALECGTVVWILLVARVRQIGDSSYNKMSEALENSSSSAVTAQLSVQGS